MKIKPRVLVIGDVILDEWVYGDVERLSPEAPIPVLDVNDKKISLGGAGNVLVNLKSIGAEPMIISGISEDETGHTIKKMVSQVCGDDVYYFNIPESFKKQRICGNNQQIVRIDTGEGSEISNLEIDDYLERLEGKVDIVLVADYGKGTVNDYVLMQVSDFCYREKIKFLIDPYISDSYDHENFYCTMIKLNKKEAEAFTKIKINDEEDIPKVGTALLDMFDTKSILLTLGSNGMAYFDKASYKDEPLREIDNPVHIYDVCGAGDVVFAVLGYLMTDKSRNLEDIIRYTSKAGKLSVSKKGTSVVNYNELFVYFGK